MQSSLCPASVKFASVTSFLSIHCNFWCCVCHSTDVTKRICTAAEMKFYFSSFMDKKSDDAQFLRPNKNCNLTTWVPGCEPGWACTIPENAQVDLKNNKEIPDRTSDSQPCCAGFFCPRGLTCMIRKCLFIFAFPKTDALVVLYLDCDQSILRVIKTHLAS